MERDPNNFNLSNLEEENLLFSFGIPECAEFSLIFDGPPPRGLLGRSRGAFQGGLSNREIPPIRTHSSQERPTGGTGEARALHLERRIACRFLSGYRLHHRLLDDLTKILVAVVGRALGRR